jgi:hypothetical protein
MCLRNMNNEERILNEYIIMIHVKIMIHQRLFE